MQLGLEREGAGDADALALAAGELVRVVVEVLARQADAFEQLAGLVVRPGAVGEAVHQQRLAEDLADGEPGIEAAEGSWKIICRLRRKGRAADRGGR